MMAVPSYPDQTSVYDELKRLREANQLAQFVLANHPNQRKNSPLDTELNSTLIHTTQCRELSKDDRVTEIESNDIWGASQYLTDDDNDENIKFVKQYLKTTNELLQRNNGLLKISEPSDYEIVEDVESLTVDSSNNENDKPNSGLCEVDSSHTITPELPCSIEIEQGTSGAILCKGKESNTGKLKRTDVTWDLISSESELDDEQISRMCSSTQIESLTSNVITDFNNKEDYSFSMTSSASTLNSIDIASADVTESQLISAKKIDSPPTSFFEHLLVADDDFLAANLLQNDASVVNRVIGSPHENFDKRCKNHTSYMGDDDLSPPLLEIHEKISQPKRKHVDIADKFVKNSNSSLSSQRRKVPTAKNFVCDTFTDNLMSKLNLQSVNTIEQSARKIIMKQVTCVWDILPDEMMLNIFSYLSRNELNQLSLVNHRFYNLTKDSCLWQKVEASDVELNGEWFEKFQNAKPRSIYFHRCSAKALSSKVLRRFFQNCKSSLRQIHVSECMHESLFGDNILLHASSHCNKVESISVPWSNTTDNGISATTSFSILMDLNISGNCFISDDSFVPLVQKVGTTLQTLKVNGCFALTSKSFLSIAENCRNITVLEIGLCAKVTSECLQTLAKSLLSVKELDLRGLKSVNDECLTVISKHCEKLSKIVLANCTLVTDSGISDLAFELPNILDLDISGCSKVTDNGICTLTTALSGPVSLNLSSTSISYSSILTLTENCFDSLEALKLSFCNNITQDCITKLISFCYKLTCLHLHGCKRISVKSLKVNHKLLKIFS